MPLGFMLSIFSLVFLIISLLYPLEALPLALPLIGGIQPLFWMMTLLIGVVLLFIGTDFRRNTADYRPRIELLLIFFTLFTFMWAKMPLALIYWNYIDIIIFGFILAVFLKCLYNDRNNLSMWGINKTEFIPALKLLWVPTILFVSVPFFWSLIVGNPVPYLKILFEIAIYPFYAFGQLLIFLAFPMSRFKRYSQSPVQITLAVAGLFALIHWPNGIVMLACFFSMVIWSWVYLRHPNLFAVAISMGIAAAMFSQILPDKIHHKVMVGPGYVYQNLMKLPPEIILHTRIEKNRELIASDDDTPSVNDLTSIFTGREPTDFSRSIWLSIEKMWGKEMMLKGFLRGAEVRKEWHNLLSWPTRVNKSKIRRDDFYGYIDMCEVRSTDLYLSGWMADVKTGQEATSFHVFINGVPVYAAPPNILREDVSRVFEIPSETKYGFQFKLLGRPSKKIKDLRIFALAEDGIPREIKYPADYKWLNLYADEKRL